MITSNNTAFLIKLVGTSISLANLFAVESFLGAEVAAEFVIVSAYSLLVGATLALGTKNPLLRLCRKIGADEKQQYFSGYLMIGGSLFLLLLLTGNAAAHVLNMKEKLQFLNYSLLFGFSVFSSSAAGVYFQIREKYIQMAFYSDVLPNVILSVAIVAAFLAHYSKVDAIFNFAIPVTLIFVAVSLFANKYRPKFAFSYAKTLFFRGLWLFPANLAASFVGAFPIISLSWFGYTEFAVLLAIFHKVVNILSLYMNSFNEVAVNNLVDVVDRNDSRALIDFFRSSFRTLLIPYLIVALPVIATAFLVGNISEKMGHPFVSNLYLLALVLSIAPNILLGPVSLVLQIKKNTIAHLAVVAVSVALMIFTSFALYKYTSVFYIPISLMCFYTVKNLISLFLALSLTKNGD